MTFVSKDLNPPSVRGFKQNDFCPRGSQYTCLFACEDLTQHRALLAGCLVCASDAGDDTWRVCGCDQRSASLSFSDCVAASLGLPSWHPSQGHRVLECDL